jgi:hypothetical protein
MSQIPTIRKDLVAGYIEVVKNSVRKNVVAEVAGRVAPEDRRKISKEWLKRVRVFSHSIFIFFKGPEMKTPASAAFLLPVAARQISRAL